MQHFERMMPAPEILTGKLAQQHREQSASFMGSRAEALTQQYAMKSGLDINDKSMREALNRTFRGRCAFCEAATTTTPHRFRPLEEALPIQPGPFAHLYYNWLDVAWQNFYAMCQSCRPQRANDFPVDGKRAAMPSAEQYKQYADENDALWPAYPLKERALLLDPCVDRDFHKHIGAQVDGSLVGLSKQGLTTIYHFHLNAPQRTEDRSSRYKDYYKRMLEWISSPDAKHPTPFFDFPNLEFGGTWYLLLRRLAVAVGAKTSVRPVLSPTRIDRIFRQLRRTREFHKYLDQCWHQIANESADEDGNDIPTVSKHSDATLAGIRIENFKSIEHLHINLERRFPAQDFSAFPKTPSLLIIGENAAGKSSILEALALGLSSDAAIKQLGLTAKNYILNPLFLGATVPLKEERAWVEISLSNHSTRVLDIKPGSMRGDWKNSEDIIPVFAYGAFRQYQHKGRRPASPEAYIRNLFDASVLPNPEKWLLDLGEDRFDMVIRALRDILSIEGKFEVIRRDLVDRKCYVVTATAENGEPLTQSSLNVASSGFRSVLAMACDIMRGMMDPAVYPKFETLRTAQGVVLIDEVESHLHPRWKMQIMRGLRLALPGVTFIATTHDPLCLRGMNDGEVVVLRRVKSNDGTTPAGLPTRVEAQTSLPPIAELRVEQLLTSDLFQLHSTDDPGLDLQFAQIADLLTRKAEQLTDDQHLTVERFKRDVASALPIGTSEAHRLVQEAVADYLQQRALTSVQRLADLRVEVKQRIVEALQGIL